MKPRHVYAGLCVPGALLPWAHAVPWFAEHGLDVPLFFRDLFANGIAAAFATDLIISAVVVCALMLIEGRRLALPQAWAPIVGTLVIGVSFGLPLFLYMRERRLEGSRP